MYICNMSTEEIKKVVWAYNEYEKKYPISYSWSEHADPEDWDMYWDNVAKYIKKKLG